MRILYNEGRVVGLSSYELYIRSQLAEGADPSDLPSESEWVAKQTTNARGGSMILKIAQGTTAGVHDYTLPEGTTFIPDGPMTASLFEGNVTCISGTPWASHITDYGRLISNTSSSSPTDPGTPSHVPTKSNPTTMSATYRKQCVDYMKLNSALAVQVGEWSASGQSSPYKLLTPNLSSPGFIRISITEAISTDIYLLITGFTSAELIEGITELEDLTQDYKSGEFLGPLVFPWANKVQLLMTADSLKGYLDWYLDATLTTAQYEALTTKENKFYFTRKS